MNVSKWEGEKRLPPHVEEILNSDPDPEDFSPESVCFDGESMRDCLVRILAYGVTKEPFVGPPTKDMRQKVDDLYVKIDNSPETAQYVRQEMEKLYKKAFDRRLEAEDREAAKNGRIRLNNVYCAYLDEMRNGNNK